MIRRTLKIATVIGVLAVLFAAGRFYSAGVRKIEKHQSLSRFAQLENLLIIYHSRHGTFPPTQFQLEPGEPIHSWRVLLAQHTYSDFVTRFEEYDFSQQWNSSNNLALWRHAPQGFRIGSETGQVAHYLAIGNDDVWPSEWPLKSRLVVIGDDRFLLFEDPDSTVHWMEPKY